MLLILGMMSSRPVFVWRDVKHSTSTWRSIGKNTHGQVICCFATQLWNWLGDLLHRPIDTTLVIYTFSCVPDSVGSQVRDLFI